jgi:hypothetical protein
MFIEYLTDKPLMGSMPRRFRHTGFGYRQTLYTPIPVLRHCFVLLRTAETTIVRRRLSGRKGGSSTFLTTRLNR